MHQNDQIGDLFSVFERGGMRVAWREDKLPFGEALQRNGPTHLRADISQISAIESIAETNNRFEIYTQT